MSFKINSEIVNKERIFNTENLIKSIENTNENNTKSKEISPRSKMKDLSEYDIKKNDDIKKIFRKSILISKDLLNKRLSFLQETQSFKEEERNISSKKLERYLPPSLKNSKNDLSSILKRDKKSVLSNKSLLNLDNSSNILQFFINNYYNNEVSFNQVLSEIYLKYIKIMKEGKNKDTLQLPCHFNNELQITIESKLLDLFEDEDQSTQLQLHESSKPEDKNLNMEILNTESTYYNPQESTFQYYVSKVLSYLSNPFQTEDLYKIYGTYNKIEIRQIRKFEDIKIFRDILKSNYPGLFIPQIPSEMILTNHSEYLTLNLKKNLLQTFFNKISKISILTGSQELRFFLEKNVSSSVLNNGCVKTVREILKEYKRTFPMFYYKSNEEIGGFHEGNIENKEKKEEFNIENVFSKQDDDELDTSRIKTNEDNIETSKFQISKEENKKLIGFYKFLLGTRDMLQSIIHFTAMSERGKLEENNANSTFYEYLFEYDNNILYEMSNITNKSQRKELNKDIIQCKLTEFLFNSNFENVYLMIFNWTNNELLDIVSMIECLDSIFEYDMMIKTKVDQIKTLNSLLENRIKEIEVTNGKDYSFSNSIIYKISEMKCEVKEIFRLSEMLYKIVNFLVIPSFKKDKLKAYFNILKIISDVEMSRFEKDLIIKETISEHCVKIKKIIV